MSQPPAGIACFLRNAEVELDPDAPLLSLITRCWIWDGARGDNGYAKMRWGGRVVYAYRWGWEYVNGPIPCYPINSEYAGLSLEMDHFFCNNGAEGCANPMHVRPTTQQENVTREGSTSVSAINARKTHCIHGHSLHDAYTTTGGRQCRPCTLQRAATIRARKREQQG